MSAGDLTPEQLDDAFEAVAPTPKGWALCCPNCRTETDCDLEQIGDEAAWGAETPAAYLACESCQQLMEVVDVRVVALASRRFPTMRLRSADEVAAVQAAKLWETRARAAAELLRMEIEDAVAQGRLNAEMLLGLGITVSTSEAA